MLEEELLRIYVLGYYTNRVPMPVCPYISQFLNCESVSRCFQQGEVGAFSGHCFVNLFDSSINYTLTTS